MDCILIFFKGTKCPGKCRDKFTKKVSAGTNFVVNLSFESLLIGEINVKFQVDPNFEPSPVDKSVDRFLKRDIAGSIPTCRQNPNEKDAEQWVQSLWPEDVAQCTIPATSHIQAYCKIAAALCISLSSTLGLPLATTKNLYTVLPLSRSPLVNLAKLVKISHQIYSDID